MTRERTCVLVASSRNPPGASPSAGGVAAESPRGWARAGRAANPKLTIIAMPIVIDRTARAPIGFSQSSAIERESASASGRDDKTCQEADKCALGHQIVRSP